MENIFRERIEQLRAMMRSKAWDAVIISGGDPHNSEYPAPRWQQVKWISGFTGEAGDIVITLDHAGLWTDTRYFIQAVRQLKGSGVELHKTRVQEQVLIPQWLETTFPEDAIIAVDGLCQSVGAMEDLNPRFNIVSIPNMLDAIWKDRPAVPCTDIFEVKTGESKEQKLSWFRQELYARGCSCALVTALDDIAWLLNIRASDIEYNPLALGYLYVDAEDEKFFTHESYNDVELFLGGLQGKVMADPSSLNYHLYSILKNSGAEILFTNSPVKLRKSIKNSVEIDGMRKAHIMDGVAMEKFLFWLESSLNSGKNITEWDAAVKLGKCRALIRGYMGDSFETISAFGEGAALPHYITPKENAPLIDRNGLYLCDSGGQYLYGTTDITRTVPLGNCSNLEKEDYTLVLKAHIDLAMAIFPAGTAGCQIDALAREALWKSHRNFGHGTGHGVGYFLGVHEGPQSIRQDFNPTPLQPGMITSNEPGIYREGMHGVRHENLILCVEKGENEFGKWLGFETLTLCHIDTLGIIPELLTKEEKNWLNEYNENVYNVLGPLLPKEITFWLRGKTLPIG